MLPVAGVAESRPAALVSIRGVAKSYAEGPRRREVLRDASLDVGAGDTVAILGRSGSGKTTLLNLIAAIDLPEAGDILVAGRSVVHMPEAGRTRLRRKTIGLVFQFFNLIPTLTVAENLRLPLELNRVGAADAAKRVTAMLEAIGLADRAGSDPDALSGGEQQRVALGRALIHRPALLLADEPTGNLDTDTAARMLALMMEAAGAVGATVIVATHSRAVADAAVRVYTIRDGALVPG